MKARIKRILQAAAVLVAGGAALAAAIITANQQDQQPLSCAEWSVALSSMGDQQVEFFLAASTTYVQAGVPTVSATRVLGQCSGGECVIPTPCGDYRYPFDISPAVNGWRLARVYAHPYIAGGWSELATAVGPSSLRYWSVRSSVVAACLGLLTQLQCRSLFQGLDDCWLRTDGQQCRGGRLYGPGLGGVNADGSAATCSVQASDTWVACSDAGRGVGWALTSYDDSAPVELDLP
jgi:hypothetical protein